MTLHNHVIVYSAIKSSFTHFNVCNPLKTENWHLLEVQRGAQYTCIARDLILNVLALLGNGFIEGGELDKFLRELISSINLCDYGPEVQTLIRN